MQTSTIAEVVIHSSRWAIARRLAFAVGGDSSWFKGGFEVQANRGETVKGSGAILFGTGIASLMKE